MNFALIVLLITIAGVLMLTSRVNMMFFILYNSATAAVGLIILAVEERTGWITPGIYALIVASLSLGYIALRPRDRRVAVRWNGITKRKSIEAWQTWMRSSSHGQDTAVHLLVIVVGATALYHLAASGLPFLSGSIEVERFDFTSSGFFGIPGRMYLYGVPLAWAFTSMIANHRSVRWQDYGPWRLATGIYLACSLLSGFKSGIAAMVTIMVIFSVLISGKKVLLRNVVRRYWYALPLPAIYGYLTAASYSTYARSDSSFFQQVYDRVTIVGAEPKMLAIEQGTTVASDLGFVNDLRYFVFKYAGNEIPGSYSTERWISARIIGVDPSSAAWTTPVTVGGLPELVLNFNAPLAVILAFMVGALIRSIHRSGQGLLSKLCSVVVGYILYSWLLRGGLVYYTLNILAVALMLSIFYILVLALSAKKNKFEGNSGQRGARKGTTQVGRALRTVPQLTR